MSPAGEVCRGISQLKIEFFGSVPKTLVPWICLVFPRSGRGQNCVVDLESAEVPLLVSRESVFCALFVCLFVCFFFPLKTEGVWSKGFIIMAKPTKKKKLKKKKKVGTHTTSLAYLYLQILFCCSRKTKTTTAKLVWPLCCYVCSLFDHFYCSRISESGFLPWSLTSLLLCMYCSHLKQNWNLH